MAHLNLACTLSWQYMHGKTRSLPSTAGAQSNLFGNWGGHALFAGQACIFKQGWVTWAVPVTI